MSFYKSDRSFTNYVHKNLAINQIYKPLKWNVKKVDFKNIERLDIVHGIDYIINDSNGQNINIQERFRDCFYKNFNDVTLRYRRNKNPNPERIKSEFFKIKADFLVYGITNGKKFEDQRHTLTSFNKWVIINIKFLKKMYLYNQLEIIPAVDNYCKIIKNKMFCPEIFNTDNSSSFLPFNVLMLNKLWGEKVIFKQKGYIN